MWLACNRRSASGRLASGRCRPNPGADEAARHRVCAATAGVSLFPPRRWRGGFPRRLGASFHGGRALEILSSRFAAVRIRPASRDWKFSTPHPLEWLLIEWPEGEKEPTKYWLSTLPEDIPFDVLVDMAKLRWRIERDYEELKSELGLAHFEGRSWREFHHHAVLCIAAYGFLIRERSGDSPLRPPAAPNVSPILASQTQRRRQSDPNDMSKIRSRRSEGNLRSRSPAASCAARVAKLCHHDDPIPDHRDTVELARLIQRFDEFGPGWGGFG